MDLNSWVVVSRGGELRQDVFTDAQEGRSSCGVPAAWGSPFKLNFYVRRFNIYEHSLFSEHMAPRLAIP